jgi:hypothetical protein
MSGHIGLATPLVRRAGEWAPARSVADEEPGLGSGREEEFVLPPNRACSSSVRTCRCDTLLEALLSLFEQTAFSGRGPRSESGVLHNGSRCCVQIGCCGIQARISLKQNNQARQVLPEECLQLTKIGLLAAELDGVQGWGDQRQLFLNRIGEPFIRHEQLSPVRESPPSP